MINKGAIGFSRRVLFDVDVGIEKVTNIFYKWPFPRSKNYPKVTNIW